MTLNRTWSASTSSKSTMEILELRKICLTLTITTPERTLTITTPERTLTITTPERTHLESLTDTLVLGFCHFSGFLELKGLEKA